MRRILAAIGLLACSGSAIAQYSGVELQRHMRSTNREQNIAAMYFIGGVVDTNSMVYNVQAFTLKEWDRTLFFCIPETIKLGDIYAVVKSRMDRPIVALTEPASTHVSRILREVWPCQNPPSDPQR